MNKLPQLRSLHIEIPAPQGIFPAPPTALQIAELLRWNPRFELNATAGQLFLKAANAEILNQIKLQVFKAASLNSPLVNFERNSVIFQELQDHVGFQLLIQIHMREVDGSLHFYPRAFCQIQDQRHEVNVQKNDDFAQAVLQICQKPLAQLHDFIQGL